MAEKKRTKKFLRGTDDGRECTRCRVFKLWDAFGVAKRGLNGRQSVCRSCEAKRRRSGRSSTQAWRRAHPAKAAAQRRREGERRAARAGRIYRGDGSPRPASSLRSSEREAARQIGVTLRWWFAAQGSRWLDFESYCRRARAKAKRIYWRDPKKGIEKARLGKRRYYDALKSSCLTAADLAQMREDAESCGYCGRVLDAETVHLDHIVPLSAGGETERPNLVAVCFRCNASKGARSLDDWLAEQPAHVRDRARRSVA